MNTVIETQNLQRTFGEIRAVAGLTFNVERGEVFGLLGPNGAGKTTTVRLLNGILPPSGGRAHIFGLDPSAQGDAIRRQTGVLTENPSLYERLSARENLLFFGALADIPKPALEKRAAELLSFFGLESRTNDKVETYSKGMKQRLALARALIHQPPLLFLDEPTAGLDPEAAQHVDALIESMHGDGQTVVLCTHNLTEAQRLCDRVGIMNAGQFLAVGSLGDLSRQLWPETWVDFQFREEPEREVVNGLQSRPDVLQVQTDGRALSVRLKNEEAIPLIVRYLASRGNLLRVHPREYTLEEIYFALQNRQA